MKAKYKEILQTLSQLESLSGQFSSAAGMSSGIPALSMFGNALYSLNLFLARQVLMPFVKEIKDLQNNNGPLAQFAKMNRLIHPEESYNETLEEQIARHYPPHYEAADAVNLSNLLDGLIPNKTADCFDDKGQLILDLFDYEPKIDECMNEKFWKNKSITFKFHAQTDPQFFPEKWQGALTATLKTRMYQSNHITLELEVVYSDLLDDHSKVVTLYTLSLRHSSTPSCTSPQVSVYNQPPLDWSNMQSNALNFFNISAELGLQEAPTSEVFNRYENLCYPVGRKHTSHALTKKMFSLLLRDMGVNIKQKEFEEWADSKYLYLKVKELLQRTPLTEEPLDNISTRSAVKGIEYKNLSQSFYGFPRGSYGGYDYPQICNEFRLIEPVEDKEGEFLTNQDIPRIGTAILYVINLPGQSWAAYSVCLLLHDKTEEAQIFIALDKEVVIAKPTPRTIFWFVESLRKTREEIIKKKRR